MRAGLSRASVVATFLRAFLIQGSWNYHTMLGSGFGFAMLPGLRRIFGSDAGALRDALERHTEHFNAHPYLANVALGAALRLEADGADAATIRRFKQAVRGPLGSLGDGLVWATWLPGASVLALALYWLGAPAWLGVVAFLAIYNAGHLGLRIWGLRVGLASGQQVGRRLGSADLGGWTKRLEPVVVLLLGLLLGALLGGRGGLLDTGWLWVGLTAAGFVAGLLAGHRAWRPAAVATVAAIGFLALWGMLT